MRARQLAKEISDLSIILWLESPCAMRAALVACLTQGLLHVDTCEKDTCGNTDPAQHALLEVSTLPPANPHMSAWIESGWERSAEALHAVA